MREITFDWCGEQLRLSPHFALIERIAQELRQVTEGTETTIGLAYKCVHGGLEPVVIMVPLMHFLREAKGADCPTKQEVFDRILSEPHMLVSFRVAYVQAMLPNVDMGKDPAAPLEPGKAAAWKAPAKSRKR